MHTFDIYKEGVSTRRVNTQEFTAAVIANLGQLPQKFPAVSYRENARITLPKYARKAPKAKTLQGVSEFKQLVLELANSTEVSVPSDTETVKLAPANPLQMSRQLAAKYGIQASIVLKTQNRIDAFMLNNLSGSIAFLLVMFLLFQSIFTFATPLMDGVESLLGATAAALTEQIGPGMFSDFLNDALWHKR